MEYYEREESCSSTPPPCSPYPRPPFLPHHQGVFIHDHRQHLQPQQLQQQQNHDRYQVTDVRDAAASSAAGGARDGAFVFPPQVVSTVLPWTLPSTITTVTTVNSSTGGSHLIHHDHGRLSSSLVQPPPPRQPAALLPRPHLYGDFYTRRAAAAAAALRFGHDGALVPQDPLTGLTGLYAASGGGVAETYFREGGMSSTTTSPFGSLQSEFRKMTAQEIMDAKALAASKSHSEAERRRRERINNHLARLRSLLPSTTKTDKASLLAEVIQHVKELKRRTSRILEESPMPSESDELTVDATEDDDGKFVVKASMCCEDRSDLLTRLVKALKELRLRTLKAEITTLGGRVKNVFLVTGEDGRNHTLQEQQQTQYSVSSIQEALKAIMERSSSASDDHPSSTTAAGTTSSTGVKKQRTANLSSILDNISI